MSSVSHGFVEAGHLYGRPAVVVEMDSRVPPVNFHEVTEMTRRAKSLTHIVINEVGAVGEATAHEASLFGRNFRSAGLRGLSVQIRPGVTIPDDILAYDSILTVTDDDLTGFTASALDYRAASVSVHFWPGSGLLSVIDRLCEAPRGRFLVLNDSDFGHAKVWARTNPHWHLMPYKDYKTVEHAEFEEMTHGKI